MRTSPVQGRVGGRTHAPRSTLSHRLFGIVWEPTDLGGVLALPYEEDDALEFVAAHYPRIFGGDDRNGSLLHEETNDAKRRFVGEMDVFVFRKDGYPIGVSLAHPTDWSSYYFRSFALVEGARSQGLAHRFLEHMLPRLRAAGLHRAEAEVQSSNGPMMHVLAAHGFVVTGTSASERWGLIVRMTHHLSSAARAAFVSTYAPNGQGTKHPDGPPGQTPRRNP